MLSKSIKKLIVILCVIFAMLCGNIVARASGIIINPFKLNPKNIVTYNQTSNIQSKGKILVYSTHDNEGNKNSTILENAQNLCDKLTKKGWIVEHCTQSFVLKSDYNNAYYNSRKMLDSKGDSLKDYDLIIDYHNDSASVPISTTINNQSVVRFMFPTVDQNINLKQQQALIRGITKNLKEFSNDMVREETTKFHKGIVWYNSDKSPNFILIEVGGNLDDAISVARGNTFLCSAINSYLSNK